MYVDESGDHTYNSYLNVQDKYLGLTGIIFEIEYYNNYFQPSLEDFKKRIFEPDPDYPVILHRTDIIDCKSIFHKLRNKTLLKEFNDGLLNLIKEHEFTIISVVINKESHRDFYHEQAYHPYHYCLTAIMERYCYMLRKLGKTGDIMAEARGGEEDKKLKEVYRQVYNNGSFYLKKENCQKFLTSKELKLKPKYLNIAGLQLADIIAYCCKSEIANLQMSSFTKQINECISSKYDRNQDGTIIGYGQILLNK
jgi:hypothetical protein